MSDRAAEIRRLRRQRPRSRFIRGSVAVLLILIAASWLFALEGGRPLRPGERAERVERFFAKVRPHPVRDREFDWGEVGSWAARIWSEKGLDASLTTLCIAVAAIVLAGLMAGPLCMLGARSLASPEPYLPGARAPTRLRRWSWLLVSRATRSLFILVRAIPEYMWAFLLVQIIGPTGWAAVFALAVHNFGILGRLGAETVENLPHRVPSALRGLGASRMQIAGAVAYPTLLPRFLLYFFYRWETCVRVATVLGVLGIATLGYWIDDARHSRHYDELMLFVLFGAAIVIVGDLVSAVARGFVRRAT